MGDAGNGLKKVVIDVSHMPRNMRNAAEKATGAAGNKLSELKTAMTKILNKGSEIANARGYLNP
jgi:uncharacterized protein (UPF0147 family)